MTTPHTGQTSARTKPLPNLLAGPILRHVSTEAFTAWLVTSKPLTGSLILTPEHSSPQHFSLTENNLTTIQLGNQCYLQLIHCSPSLPVNSRIFYEIECEEGPLFTANKDHLLYKEAISPYFHVPHKLQHVLHGSCRKPHHPSQDALVELDDLLQSRETVRPDLLIMTGDQIYADDVAAPTLVAIHQLIERLGLPNETFEGATIQDSRALRSNPNTYYLREHLLPSTEANQDVIKLFFGGAKKPIFTSAGAQNHLISLSEVLAMYLLVWSPTCWSLVDIQAPPSSLNAEQRQRYREELKHINGFCSGLGSVQRALAHIPVYMIFDDHDISDDWNLTRGWEEAAYENPFSRRIIGNALIGYTLCQGWGNAPSQFEELQPDLCQLFSEARSKTATTENPTAPSSSHLKKDAQDALINRLIDWDHWHFRLETDPVILVLDTRTHRWRSESSANKPSGLMDWESLSDLQQNLIQQKRVILVSPSPIFGVKLVETIQRIFTFFGRALMVDAENWMAHPGSANAILNIFRHRKTPQEFFILSGDVHYSFAYDVTLRLRKNSPRILQITASGLKNQFPEKLLVTFDLLNRFLYSSYSPLNWFTKRKKMKVKSRSIQGQKSRTLLNQSGIGQVILGETIEQTEISVRYEGKEQRFELPQTSEKEKN